MTSSEKPEGLLKKETTMMKLDKLIASRETVSTKEFPLPVAELLARYEQLYTGAMSDVLREHALRDQGIGQLIPLRPGRSIAGIAFIVMRAPNVKITGELTDCGQMLDEMRAKAFVVWDTTNDEKATLGGGVMTATVVAKGVKAAVIDGGNRDTHQILEKEFPVFYKYRIRTAVWDVASSPITRRRLGSAAS